jgi:hypothetical protein
MNAALRFDLDIALFPHPTDRSIPKEFVPNLTIPARRLLPGWQPGPGRDSAAGGSIGRQPTLFNSVDMQLCRCDPASLAIPAQAPASVPRVYEAHG